MIIKRYILGYTQGTFDMFHIGHLNLLRNAKSLCDRLIVGVNSDDLVQQYKKKVPVINENERAEIVKALRYVDDVFICDTLDKTVAWESIHFNAIFIGDDWKGNPRWSQTEKDLAKYGAEVIYLKHTEGISSTLLRVVEGNKISEEYNGK